MNANDFQQIVIAILSPLTAFTSTIVAILAWVAKIKWSQEYALAKDETIKSLHEQINSKQEQIESKSSIIEVKEAQIAKLEALDSNKIHEYFTKQKKIFENIIIDSEKDINLTKKKLTHIEKELDKAINNNQHDKQIITKLKSEQSELQERIMHLNDSLVQEVQNRKQIETYINEMPLVLNQTSFVNFGEAFSGIENFSRTYLDQCTTDNIPLTIKYELIAVAMTFSWSFIQKTIPDILEKYPTAQIELNLVFVDWEYLKTLNLSIEPVDWAEESRSRTQDIKHFAASIQKYQKRLSFTVRTYQNLPHWHGWLINNEYLFLGRTDWNITGSRPILTVGQNKYRFFDVSNVEGLERISLFQDWHTYYSYFTPKSQLIYPTVESNL